MDVTRRRSECTCVYRRFLLPMLLASAAIAHAADPLARQVTIYRDDYGVPHIVGDTVEATFFGYGYAQAEDHLERMMLQYRDAQGRRSEVLGFEALGQGYLQFIPYEYRWDGDYLQRLLRTFKGVVERKHEVDPEVYTILDAFARGVNAFIDGHRARVPGWVDKVTAEDIEALFQVLGQSEKKFSLEEIQRLAVDTYVMPADVIVPLLVRAADRIDAAEDAGLGEAIRLLKAWDRRSTTESVAYTYLHFWGRAYQELFSNARFARFVSQERRRIDLTSSEEQQAAIAALKQALARIEKHFGTTQVPWGKVNVVIRGGTFPMDGDSLFGVLHPDYGPDQESGQIHCNNGWGHLMVVMEGEPKEIWSLLPYGQSEDPASPHDNDQARLHSQGQMKRFWFTPQEILAHTKSVWGDGERIKKLLPPP